MILLFLIIISIFWAMNMGASGMAVSFAASVGSKIVKQNKAVIIFTFFVLIGALLIGPKVGKTLSSQIIAPEFMNQKVVLIILTSSCISIFIANLVRIPLSTSITIVSSYIGAGLYFKSLNVGLIIYLVSVWIGVSVLSYFITYFIANKIYPPRKGNFRFYERFFYHKNKLRRWTLYTDFYSAFGIGTNNVANVVGPLIAANVLSPNIGFVVFSLLFGVGGWVLGRGVLNTVSKEIVPLGIISASIVSLIVSTFIVICSLLGLPAPYVQFSSFSILAIHTVKEEKEHIHTLFHPITKKILKVWVFTPILSMGICYLLLKIWSV